MVPPLLGYAPVTYVNRWNQYCIRVWFQRFDLDVSEFTPGKVSDIVYSYVDKRLRSFCSSAELSPRT